jgi:hypothetical protein
MGGNRIPRRQRDKILARCDRLADLGGIALTGSPNDFGKLIVEETEKWAKVVKLSSAKLD